MARQLLAILAQGSSGKSEIAEKLGKTKPTRYLNDLVAKLLLQRLIEMTLPDKPNSRFQKYRLTAKGTALKKRMDQRGMS
jgi:ATP-dependent DNA helicase RecG